LRRLVEAGVDFVVVGGVAVIAQAYPRVTKDLDICYASDPVNLRALGDALEAAHARLRGIEEDLPFTPDARSLRQPQILCLTTDDGNLDLLVEPDGAPPYPVLRSRAEVIELDGMRIHIASLDDLVAMKLAAGRPQDLLDLEALEIARRRRGHRH
jgi:predicted nucleotidyltransferase